MHGPVGIAQQLTRQQYQVGLAIAHDLIGLRSGGDHADRAGGDAGFAPDALGEGNLISRADRNNGVRYQATGGAVDQIGTLPFNKAASSTDSSMVQPPSAQSVAEMRTNSGQPLGPDGAYSGCHLEHEAHTVGEAAAVFVVALVAERRQELMRR